MSDSTPQGDPGAAQRPPVHVTPDNLKAWAGTTWRLLILLVGVVVLAQVVGWVAPVIIAIFFAMIFTALAGPVANFFHKVMPKPLAIILAIVLIAIAVLAVLGGVINSVIHEGPKIVASVQNGFTQLQQWLQDGPLHLSDDTLNQLMTQLGTWGKQIGEALAGDIAGGLGSIGTLIIAGSVFIFGVIFFMNNPRSIWRWVLMIFPARVRNTIDTSGDIAWGSISGYTRGIVIVALADATLVFIGLTILQVPLAPALAAVVFLGAFIPVIGAPIATFFAAIVALAERGWVVAALTIVLTVIVGSFDGDVLQPLVMGRAVNIHPLAIVVLIAAGSLTLGIIGAFVAVPIGAAAWGVFKYLSGRDPDHPRPWAWGAPGVDPDQPAFVPPEAKVKKRRFWRRHTITPDPD